MIKTKLFKVVLLIPFLLIIFSCDKKVKSENEIIVDISTPSQIISVEQAIEMKDAYQDSIGSLIKDNFSTKDNPYEPTMFAFISLDSLKQYMSYLEEVERLNEKKISGVRIYFAAYPNKEKLQSTGKTPIYKGRETFFIAPTMEVEPNEWGREYPNLRNIPFYIEPSGDNKLVGKFKAIDKLLFDKDSRPSITKRDSIGDETGKTSLILNEMQLTPPPKK